MVVRTRQALKLAAVIVLLWCSFARAQAQQPRSFMFDPAQTKVTFTLGASMHTVHGSFKLTRGTILFDPATGRASGELVVDATSGESGNGSRDKKMHKEILESQKFQTITFTPQHFTGTLPEQGKSHLVVEGQFNIHGESHPMTLNIDADLNGGNATATTTFAVPYKQWGMKDPSAFLLHVNDKVEISIQTAAHTGMVQAVPR
ncbi:MAG TPA: YceI family protein [Candidatus Angelobacter sp.]|jgi:polyisoprenoid-binding protein YceI|nr:YceI family protein [Candidatus Angelobacter sp.]